MSFFSEEIKTKCKLILVEEWINICTNFAFDVVDYFVRNDKDVVKRALCDEALKTMIKYGHFESFLYIFENYGL